MSAHRYTHICGQNQLLTTNMHASFDALYASKIFYGQFY